MSGLIEDKKYKIFKPSNSSKYWVRFSIKGQGQQRQSLGTDDENEAEQLASAAWHEANALHKAGLSVTRKKFETIAEEFIKEIEFEVECGEKEEYQLKQYIPIIRRYFIPYFENKALSAITSADIEAYWKWRASYWSTGPGRNQKYIHYERDQFVDGELVPIKIRRPVKEGPPSKSTMNKEAMLLRQLFEFGRRHKYTLDVPIIKTQNSKKRSITAKPGFTLKEFLRLESISLSRIAEAEQYNDQDKLLNKRRKLHCYIMIAGFTGMRPTELKRMIWGDIEARELELDNGQVYDAAVIQVRGKGKEREMVPLPEVLTHLNILRNLFHMELGRVPNDDDPVFANPNGTAVQSFKSGLAELLKAASLRTSADGRLRDSGSFRPFYISQQIREGVNPHMLIRNTGTSGKMVNEHYNKILPTEEIAKLTPDWLKRRSKINQKMSES